MSVNLKDGYVVDFSKDGIPKMDERFNNIEPPAFDTPENIEAAQVCASEPQLPFILSNEDVSTMHEDASITHCACETEDIECLTASSITNPKIDDCNYTIDNITSIPLSDSFTPPISNVFINNGTILPDDFPIAKWKPMRSTPVYISGGQTAEIAAIETAITARLEAYRDLYKPLQIDKLDNDFTVIQLAAQHATAKTWIIALEYVLKLIESKK